MKVIVVNMKKIITVLQANLKLGFLLDYLKTENKSIKFVSMDTIYIKK